MIVDLAAVAADSPEFQSWIIGFLEANPPLYPISQITGFSQYAARTAVATTVKTTASATYVSFADGPTLSGLPDGKYLLLYGADMHTDASLTASARMNFSVNGAAVADGTIDANCGVAGYVSCTRPTTVSLAGGGSNSIEGKYRTDNAAVTATFGYRWITALRYSNL